MVLTMWRCCLCPVDGSVDDHRRAPQAAAQVRAPCQVAKLDRQLLLRSWCDCNSLLFYDVLGSGLIAAWAAPTALLYALAMTYCYVQWRREKIRAGELGLISETFTREKPYHYEAEDSDEELPLAQNMSPAEYTPTSTKRLGLS